MICCRLNWTRKQTSWIWNLQVPARPSHSNQGGPAGVEKRVKLKFVSVKGWNDGTLCGSCWCKALTKIGREFEVCPAQSCTPIAMDGTYCRLRFLQLQASFPKVETQREWQRYWPSKIRAMRPAKLKQLQPLQVCLDWNFWVPAKVIASAAVKFKNFRCVSSARLTSQPGWRFSAWRNHLEQKTQFL